MSIFYKVHHELINFGLFLDLIPALTWVWKPILEENIDFLALENKLIRIFYENQSLDPFLGQY